MFDSIGLQECAEFFRTELRFMVADKNVWNAIATKKAPKNLYGSTGCGAFHDVHLRPFGMCVHCDQIHMSLKWTCNVHMYPFPRTGWPQPRL